MPSIIEVQRVLSYLRTAAIENPNVHTPKVYPVLDRLCVQSSAIAELDWDERVKTQALYDLLLIAASDIDAICPRPSWTLNTLLELLAKIDSRREEHPFHRGLVMHRHLSFKEQGKLAKLAYERIKPYLSPESVISLKVKAKMSLGNIFAGTRNLGLLIAIHPSLIRLRLAYGDLRTEFAGFLNELLTDILAYPRINSQFSVLSLENATRELPSIVFDYKKGLRLLDTFMDKSLFKIAEGELLTRQAETVQLKVDLLKQLRVILFHSENGQPSRVSKALGTRTKLRENLHRIVAPMSDLRPLYTWGTVLDEAVNDLFDEIKGVAADLKKALDFPVEKLIVIKAAAPAPKAWNMVGSWDDLKVHQGSTKEAIKEIANSVIPARVLKIMNILKKVMPGKKTEIEHLLESFQKHFKQIQDHASALIQALEPSPFYGPTIQALLTPLRPHLFKIHVPALQKIIALYRHQFEPQQKALEAKNWDLKTFWGELKPEIKSELLLNLAATCFHLRDFVDSILPLLDTSLMIRLREKLNAMAEDREHFDALLTEVRGLQILLREKTLEPLSKLIAILDTKKEVIDVTVISKAFFGEFKGKVVGSAAKADLSIELDLSLNPTQRKIEGLPSEWAGMNLRQIFKREIDELVKILNRFNAIDFQAVLLTSDAVAQPRETATL